MGPPAPPDVEQSISALRLAGKHLAGELHAIVKALLGRTTRDSMLKWLAGVIEGNMERAKMQVGPPSACRDRFQGSVLGLPCVPEPHPGVGSPARPPA